MRKGFICLFGALSIGLILNPMLSRETHAGKQRLKYTGEAKQIFKGKRSKGDLAKWEMRLEEEKKRRKSPFNIALCHTTVGAILVGKRYYPLAMEHLSEALDITRRHQFVGLEMQALHWLGMAQKRQGRLDDAMESFNKSLHVARRKGNNYLVSKNILMMSRILLMRGRYQESLDQIHRLKEIVGDLENKKLMMRLHNQLGWIHIKQGNSQAAREHFDASLKLSRELGNKKWTAANLNGLGETCFQEGKSARALGYYRQAFEMLRNLQKKAGMAITLNNMGRAHLNMGRHERALQLFIKSRNYAISKGMRALLGHTSLNIGKVYSSTGGWDEAGKWVDEAIIIFTEPEIPDMLRDCYETKGIILENQGDIEAAEYSYRESVSLLEALRQDVVGGEEEALDFLESRGNAYHRLISLLMKQGKASEALMYLERSQLKKLRDQFDWIRPDLNRAEEQQAKETERKLREQIEAARIQLKEEQSKSEEEKDQEKITELEQALTVKKQHYIEYINDLREKYPELASLLAIQPDALIDLQKLLPSQVALLQYLILDERLYIFVVTEQSLAYKEVPVQRSDIEGRVDYFRSFLMNPIIPLNTGPLEGKTLRPTDQDRSKSFEMLIEPFLQTSEHLYQTLIAPVENEVDGFRILGIVPNGKLHLLPFQALGKRQADGTFQFLLEKKSIFHLNSQSILKFAQQRATPLSGKEGRLVAFGNPDESLAHAETEVRLIRNVFEISEIYVGTEASEERAKEGLSGFNILHLATHGKMTKNIKESHILLSKTPDGKEDGHLYIREVWGLPLEGYQLVTLSACETAKGQEASGDVMVSLQTAFLRAGTPTILASLWEVDDQATGVLMRTFYENFRNQGKAEALRSAQLSLMKDPRYVYPYYWAPFILAGDWR